MGYVEHRDPQLSAQNDEFHAQLFAQLGVEVRQRFIHHEQPRAPDDGSSDGDALHLASRETLGRPIQQSLDVQQPRRPLHLLSDVVYIRAELGSGAP